MSASSLLGLAGNYFGGPIGGFIGSVLGTLLDPADDITNIGPRLQDRKITTTGYGQTIPIVYGTDQVSGHIIEPKNFELTEVRHESEESGGKGGPTVTNVSFTYSATFAALISDGTIVGVRKIWLDADLVYDFSASTTASGISASNKAANGIRIYTGSETQTVDSILEGLNGAGNTPAYRGRAYIVFDALQLEKYGNRLPNIRVEVVGSGSKTIAGKISEETAHADNYNGMVITDHDNGIYRVWDKVETDLGAVGVIHFIDTNGAYIGSEPALPTASRLLSQDNFPANGTGSISTYKEVGTLGLDNYIYTTGFGNPFSTFTEIKAYRQGIGGYVNVYDFSADMIQSHYLIGISLSSDHKRMLIVTAPAAGGNTAGNWYMYDDNLDQVDSGTCDFTGIGVVANGTFGHGNSWTYNAEISMMENDYTHLWVALPLSNLMYVWEIAGSVLQLKHDLSESYEPSTGIGYGTIYADNGVAIIANKNHAGTGGAASTWSREELYTTTSATLSDIVDDIEERAGVTSGNRDNSALTDLVDGYKITRQTQARRAIEPLQTAFFFDTIETGYKLKSVKRGGASVATLDISDMGAIEYGSDPIYPLNKTRLQETELPKEVVVQYISAGRDYEVATQRSPRLATDSDEKKTIDIPVVMTDSKSKQIVEVLHFNFFAERNLYQFSLMPEYTYLDPSDIITVIDGGDAHTIRINSMNLTPAGVIQCDGVADRPALYASTSTGADNSSTAVTIAETGPTKAVYGNWPMFTNGQNDQSIYIASSGFLSGWKGGIHYRSLDNGASYLQTATAVTASTIGSTTDILAEGVYSTFDYASTVNVNLLSGTLSSSTKLAVLNGANPMMIGSELIQFVDATLESDGTYTLSTLLRGRKGTEWAMSGHAAGDDAVLVDTTLLRPQATLNVERKYKAVSIGNFISDTYPTSVTYTGENLKPYSVAHVKAARNASDDIVLTWISRSRFETAPLWSPTLGEDSEEYEIDIYSDNTYTTITRTITALSSATYTYTIALQTTDFGGAQTEIYVKIYQKSATVGRGNTLSEAA